VIGAIFLRHQPGQGPLIETLGFETDREGLEWAAGFRCRQRRDNAAIDPAGQKRPNIDIASQPKADRLLKEAGDVLNRVFASDLDLWRKGQGPVSTRSLGLSARRSVLSLPGRNS